MSAQADGADPAEPRPGQQDSAIDELIREVMPTLRADVVRAVLGWPDTRERQSSERSQTGWPQ